MSLIFGYARVSSIDQNLDTQIEALEKAGCQEIFTDKVSGVATSRPALDKMLDLLRPGDTIIVARLTRLGRSRDHLIKLVTEFGEKGIHFKALDLNIDTTTPMGMLVFTIFAALAEYDRQTIKERTKAGIELAKAKGKHLGRRKGVDIVSYVKVKTAYEKGMSIADTARMTGVSLASVKRYRNMIKKSNLT
ncbi:recombinase family protein [Adhaeribacter pallidiroseus]|uniref:Transposon Tn917 resolvase n=1 Tax=Adhaeribacter pallidiroseus TaxID=2072847 RepID=A0A369QJ70_9BACT|nr:recombinase family protein [Adhaeribacter pallidiroseus]RDC63297.1 Transposon Tn917 resolvase [Adhaeribacter pallidiroseus]